MKKIIIACSCIVMSLIAIADQTTTARQFLLHQLELKQVAISNQVEYINNNLNELRQDKAEFEKAFNSIVIPLTYTKTNITYKYTSDGKQIPIVNVKTVQCSVESRRYQKFVTACSNDVVQMIYEKYVKLDSSALVSELNEEMQLAKTSYDESLTRQKETDDTYTSKLSDLKLQQSAAVKEYKQKFYDQIADLQDEIKRCDHSAQLNLGFGRRSGEVGVRRLGEGTRFSCKMCKERQKQIDYAKDRITSAEFTVKNSSFNDMKTDALNTKSEVNDKYLAADIYKEATSRIFMDYKEKLVGRLNEAMVRKNESMLAELSTYMREYTAISKLLEFPEAVTPEMATIILDKEANDSLAEVYGLDLNKEAKKNNDDKWAKDMIEKDLERSSNKTRQQRRSLN